MTHIHTVATHAAPHPEEYFARWLLRREGESLFPGVSTALFVCIDKGSMPDDKNGDDLEAEGVLCLGIGGGRFDEHARADVTRIEGECVATLVAKALDLNEDPTYKPMIDAIMRNDLKGVGNDLLQIGGMVQAMNRIHDPETVAAWIDQAFDAFVERQRAYLEAREIFEAGAVIEEIPSWKGPLKLAVIHSDAEFLSSVANSRALDLDVLVVQRSTGNVQIFTTPRSGVRLTDLARILRVEEQLEKGELITTDYATLGSEGSVAGAEEWYYVTGTEDAWRPDLLLNGSRSAPNVPSTHLTLEDIVALVKVSVDANSFEQNHVRDCERGICSHSSQNPCYWKRWGLHRCWKIRRFQDNVTPTEHLVRRR